jgi:branched-chain amino acid transport system ATP-binding protein
MKKSDNRPFLQIRKTGKFFGKLAALDDVSVEINEGEAVGIVGPNGSGKTTLINTITGFYKPSAGEIVFRGQRISGLRADQICSLGIMRTFQANMIYGDTTTLENIFRGAFLTIKTGSWGQFFNVKSYRRYKKTIESRAHELLEQFGLADFKDVCAGDLPHGSQRVLGVAMAVASDPKLLLLDEPMTGMNDQEVTTMLSHISSLRAQGITVVMVEHNMKAMLKASKRLVVLDFGQVIADDKAEVVVNMKEVIECYLGKEDVHQYA